MNGTTGGNEVTMGFSKLARSRFGVAIAFVIGIAGSPAMSQQASSTAIQTGADVPQGSGGISSGASADYRVGSGDLLSISVYRSPDLQSVTRVGTDGSINFPSVGKVVVSDLTAGDIAAKLSDLLKSRGILVNPSVNVLVSEVRSKLVAVMGAVGRPGEIPLDRPGMTLAAVLARAGAAFGTGSGIVTIMSGKDDNVRERLLIADIASGQKDRLARPGELLVVQSAPMIYVSGEVGRPGSYPLEPNMTVGQALALGGGVTPRGSNGRVRLTRKNLDGTVKIMENVRPSVPMQPDDLIYVKQRVF